MSSLHEETIYGNTSELGSSDEIPSGEEQQQPIVSEKVHSLANNIYKEFESMITQYGQDVVQNLMPLVVGILENLDRLYAEKHELDIEAELLREDNQQLIHQYEREKSVRKSGDEKLLRLEDNFEEEKKKMAGKIESLESITRLLELKAKNANDHVTRLEEKEAEMKKEYQRLHERYTDLFRNHVDYLERTKHQMSESSSSHTKSLQVATGSKHQVVILRPPHAQQNRNVDSLEEEITHHGGRNISPEESPENYVSDKQRVMTEILETTPELQGRFNDSGVEENRDAQYGAISGDLPFDEMTMPDADVAEVDDENEPPVIDDQDVDSEFGMSREIENLIRENMELIETKNALNIVKDDLIMKVDDLSGRVEMLTKENELLHEMKIQMRDRIVVVEQELREVRQKLEEASKKTENPEEDESVPISQRKRFTRAEMARVLMERNQYKERLMELEDSMKWAEMLRASKDHPDLMKKKQKSVWSIFSNLFSGAGSSKRSTTGSIKYKRDQQSELLTSTPYSSSDIRSHKSFLDDVRSNTSLEIGESTPKTSRKDFTARTWMKHDPTRVQAYGWSLPSKTTATNNTNMPRVPIPIPVYCRPLLEKQPGMKVWCAAGVNLSGTRTRSGDTIIGSSVFYKCSQIQPIPEPGQNGGTGSDETVKSDEKQIELGMSSLVWICTTANSQSQVIIIDANHPAEFVDSFYITKSHALCIASIPGATEADYDQNTDETIEGRQTIDAENSPDNFISQYSVGWVQCTVDNSQEGGVKDSSNEVDPLSSSAEAEAQLDQTGEDSSIEPESTAPIHSSIFPDSAQLRQPTSLQPTMWLGCQSGHVFVHSAVSSWRRCLHSVKLNDSFTSIVYIGGRVFVSLADGSIAMFKRNADGQWDLSNYCLIKLGGPHHAVRCLTVVPPTQCLWAGFKNMIFVIDSKTLSLKKCFTCHPRGDSQVRQMCWVSDGVWVSIRLESILRLYHASTFQQLQDVDVEPSVTKMIDTSKLGVSLVRITYLLATGDRLWIGTGNGVTLSVPFSESSSTIQREDDTSDPSQEQPSSSSSSALSRNSYLPIIDMTKAQLSFHGHRDAVKFFVSVPGKPSKSGKSKTTKPDQEELSSQTLLSAANSPHKKSDNILIISGGEGYVDFRIGPEDDEDGGATSGSSVGRDRSHLIVWQIQKS